MDSPKTDAGKTFASELAGPTITTTVFDRFRAFLTDGGWFGSCKLDPGRPNSLRVRVCLGFWVGVMRERRLIDQEEMMTLMGYLFEVSDQVILRNWT